MKLQAFILLALLSLGGSINAQLKLVKAVMGSAELAIAIYGLLRAKDHFSKTEGVKGAAHDLTHKVEGKIDKAKNGPSVLQAINYKRHSWLTLAWTGVGVSMAYFGVRNLWHCNPSHS